MAVASDLPQLENRSEYKHAQELGPARRPRQAASALLTRQPEPDPRHATTRSRRSMKHAIIAIEDKRFYEQQRRRHPGIARAFVADVARQGAAQGASTIAQQFVKNALRGPGQPHRCSRSCARRRSPTS